MSDTAASSSFPRFSGNVGTSSVPAASLPLESDTTADGTVVDSTAVGSTRYPSLKSNGSRRRLLEDVLLRQPPKEAAAWLLSQARQLSTQDQASLEQLPIFEAARDLQALPLHDKQELTRKMFGGVLELEDSDRAALVSLGLRVVVQTQNEGQNLNAEESALKQNLQALLLESGVRDWPAEEMQAVNQSLGQEASALVKHPEVVLGIAHQLPPEDRVVLEEVLVETRIIPDERRNLVQAVIRPGGLLDKVNEAHQWVKLASTHFWVCLLFPLLEVILACYLYTSPCKAHLDRWLSVDSVASIVVAVAVAVVAFALRPTYEALLEDPLGAVQRWKNAASQGEATSTVDVEMRLEAAIPGTVTSGRYRFVQLGIIASVALLLVGLGWLVVGIGLMFATVVISCDSLLFVWVVLVVTFRIVILVAVADGLQMVYAEWRKDPAVSAAYYGTMDDAQSSGQPRYTRIPGSGA